MSMPVEYFFLGLHACAAGGVPATKQEDAAVGHGGRLSRRTLTAMGAGASGGKQPFAEIRKLGYVGSYATLMRFLVG